MCKRLSALVCASLAAVALTAPQAGPADPQRVQGGADLVGQTYRACAHWREHLFEACAAYFFNDAHTSLQPYCKYVHSDSYFSFLKDRFPLKYKGSARRK